MIRNVVFDFGQVMVHFDPLYMAGQYAQNDADAAQIAAVAFDRLYWDRLDAGTITDDEVIQACRDRLPKRLWEAAEQSYRNWMYHLPEVEGMRALVRHVREDLGRRVLLLSNISKGFAERASEIPCLAEFEGFVFSATCGHIKPERAIFAHLCEKFGILPHETLFVDDSPKNVAGAKAFGIAGYLFDGDAAKLRRYLDEKLK